ncbi:hypothetical protein K2V56_02540 [Staphylococcus chromogenes]|uniref:hypothetical protein n=1 Tax=Staphylococcus chromogenes TaxID=46126 RepID=UPI001E4C7102|nr:hypothetical protein [Staphylococcus chromogenes]MCD8904342.1 hypothetical protein [Staphylococcus chromogenes]
MNNGQFLMEYKDLFKTYMPSDDIEGCLYRLLQIYDDNYFMAMKSSERFSKSLKDFDVNKEGDKSFESAINVVYDMNMYIRMLATLDDILIKISVYTYSLSNNMDKNNLPSIECGTINNFRDFFKKNKLEKDNFPPLPTKLNRETRKYRNDITHGEKLMLNKGIVQERGITSFIGPKGTWNFNNDIFQRINTELKIDLKTINHIQSMLENKILEITDLVKKYS